MALPLRSALIVIAICCVPVGSASAKVLWRGGFESGSLAGWSVSNTNRITVAKSPVRDGTYSARVEVRRGDPGNFGSRIELGRNPATAAERDDVYYAFSVMNSEENPLAKGPYLVHEILFFESLGAFMQVMAMYVNGPTFTLLTTVGGPRNRYKGLLEPGVWHDFILHVKWSGDPAVGFIEFWYDGKQVVKLTHMATSIGGSANFMRMGISRDFNVPETEVIYIDGVVCATALEDVLISAPDSDGGVVPDVGSDAADASPMGVSADVAAAGIDSVAGSTVFPDDTSGGANPDTGTPVAATAEERRGAGSCSVDTHGAQGVGVFWLLLAAGWAKLLVKANANQNKKRSRCHGGHTTSGVAGRAGDLRDP